MSEQVLETGIIKKLGPFTEDLAKGVCLGKGFELGDHYSYEDLLLEELSETYIVINNTLFEYQKGPENNDYLSQVNKISEDEYSFVAYFYNGGCSLGECLEDGFKELEKWNHD